VLGAVFVALAVLSDSLYALAAGSIGERWRRSARYRRRMARTHGSVLLGLGAVAALSGERAK
jgi:threonine/homoserine/homoserine lactone efflux protein